MGQEKLENDCIEINENQSNDMKQYDLFYICINIPYRYNLDPFQKFTDDNIWNALGKCHMKETVSLL